MRRALRRLVVSLVVLGGLLFLHEALAASLARGDVLEAVLVDHGIGMIGTTALLLAIRLLLLFVAPGWLLLGVARLGLEWRDRRLGRSAPPEPSGGPGSS